MKWDDLGVVLALGREGTLAAAARRLSVDQTTVARRLHALEGALGVTLFGRNGHQLVATEAGEAALTRAERVESEILALAETLTGGDQRPQGKVRVTAVPTLINRLLIPQLDSLLGAFPDLEIELVAEPGNLNLTRREADVALRLARPNSGTALCQRIGSLGYACYGAENRDPETLPWVSYEASMAHLPQAQWIAQQRRKAGGRAGGGLLVNDAESLYQAVRAGLGQSLLPDFIGRADPGLRRTSAEEVVLTRDIWLLIHPEQRRLARVAAVVDWLRAAITRISAG